MECPLLLELREQAEARKRAERLGRPLEDAGQKPEAEWIQSVDGTFGDVFCTECVAETDDQSELRTCLINIIKAWKVKGRVGVILAHPDQHLWHAIEFVAAYKLGGVPCAHIYYAPQVHTREEARALIKKGHIMLMSCKNSHVFDAVDRHIMTTAGNKRINDGLDIYPGFITPILDDNISPQMGLSVFAFYEEHIE